MLNSILNGTENSGSVIILDSTEIEGFSFLKSIFKKLTDSGNYKIHFYCYVQKPSTLCLNCTSEIQFHDYTDSISEINSKSRGETLTRNIFPEIGLDGGPNIVFIDDLSRLINLSTPQKVFKLLNQFKYNEQKHRLFSIFHPDLHKDAISSGIQHYTQSFVALHPVSESNSLYAKVRTSHKSKSGKIRKTNEDVRILEDFGLVISVANPIKKRNFSGSGVDPMADSTFKMSLKANEVTARDQLDPPFLDQAKTIASGKIDYTPDDNDDFDEDEPDDDLDI